MDAPPEHSPAASSDQRFRPSERIRKKPEFDAVFAERRSVGNRVLVIHWRRNQLGHPRLGLVVSRRFGNAVARNRFKRRIREIFRRNKSDLDAWDLLVMPSKTDEARKAGWDELLESWCKLLIRLRERERES